MRHAFCYLLVAGGLLVCVFVSGPAASAAPPAEAKPPTPAKTDAPATVKTESPATASAELPLKRLVLYNSGVGFFERSGEIDGDKQVELKFNVEDVNDILKSMILRDLGNGQITHVTYDSPEPITHTLQTFSIDLARNPSMTDLLRQIRGEKVQVMTPTALTGTIVGVERRRLPLGKDQQLVEVDTLLLKTETGLRNVPMSQLTEAKLLNERLDKELQDALGILAQSHTGEKKTVSLNFSGKGKRPVRVGYIQEAPVWKTTYRLAIDDKEPPLLQGWAIVENTTEQDWRDVNITLVSGRPVSFQMDLYQPLFADRPVVVPEAFAKLTPRIHEQDLSPVGGQQGFASGGANSNSNFGGGGMSGFGGGGGGSRSSFGGLGGATIGQNGFGAGGQSANSNSGDQKPLVSSVTPVVDPDGDTKPADPLNLKQGISAAADGSEVGELFRYAIKLPVSLAREKAALLPIVNEQVKGEKLSLFNADVHSKHPMHAVKLVNSSKLRLSQGPITVFDSGEYAGDAQIETIAPGGERLITYALDLDVEVLASTLPPTETMAEVYIGKGQLYSKRVVVIGEKFTLKNSSEKPKKLLIETAKRTGWKLREPKQSAEKTRALYRFAVDLPADKTTDWSVMLEQDVWKKVALAGVDPDTIAREMKAAAEAIDDPFAAGTASVRAKEAVKDTSDTLKDVGQALAAAGPKVREALADIQMRRRQIETATRKRVDLELEVNDIRDEQQRIRLNMAALDKKSDLYQRYEKTLSEQEDKLIKLRPLLRGSITDETTLKKSMTEFLNELSVKEKPADVKPAEKK